jgi:Flp pilus assembly protein TadG
LKARQKGTAIVEFALVLPLLLLMTMITTEYARAIYQYNLIIKSLRDATRYLSIQTPNTKVAEAKNLVVYGNTDGTGPVLVPGLTVAKVDASWQLGVGTNPVINTVTVTVGLGAPEGQNRVTFRPLFASVFGVTFGNVSYTPISATMRGS